MDFDAEALRRDAAESGAELLDAAEIRAGLARGIPKKIEVLDVRVVVDSTNACLKDGPIPARNRVRVCAADFQSRGRGRMGRGWTSPIGSGICFSLSMRITGRLPGFESMGLAIGVAVCESLETWAPGALSLKWPNDVLTADGKLAGVLVESRLLDGDEMLAVAGVGVNVTSPGPVGATEATHASLPPAALAEVASRELPGRNEIAASLISGVVSAMFEFREHGLGAFTRRWRFYDALKGEHVVVTSGGRVRAEGVVEGLGDSGGLILMQGGERHEILSGDVTVRPVVEVGDS